MKLAVFDFDGTLFPKETLPFLLTQWRTHKYPRTRLIRTFLSLVPLYVAYKAGLNRSITKEQMIIRAIEKFSTLFRGMTENELKKFFTLVVDSMEMSFHPVVLKEIEQARQDGYHVVILSRAYTPLLKLVGERLGLDTVLGTDIPLVSGMVDSKRGAHSICVTPKPTKLEQYFQDEKVDWENSVAYADSYSDLDILEMVGCGVAVMPDPELKAAAQERRWRIIM